MIRRKKFLPIAVPDISRSEIKNVCDVLRSRWISSGPKAREFEKIFGKWHNAKYAIAVNSCTSALFLVLKSLGIKKGDAVIVPAMTWPSTANIVEQLGARTVFADIDAGSLNIDQNHVVHLLKKWKKKVKAIIPVHMAGLPVDIKFFKSLAKKYDLHIIYDAAHAHSSYYAKKNIGAYGTASCFSFYAIKNLTTGDGGIITTQDKKLADQIRLWAYHGLNKNAWKRYGRNKSQRHLESLLPGFNMQMTDISAAIGIAQVQKRNTIRRNRNRLVKTYNDLLSGIDAVKTPIFRMRNSGWANHLYIIQIMDPEVSRDKLMHKLMTSYNIGTNVHFWPVHLHTYYRKNYPGVRLPKAEMVSKRILSLPLSPQYLDSDARYVSRSVKSLINDKSVRAKRHSKK